MVFFCCFLLSLSVKHWRCAVVHRADSSCSWTLSSNWMCWCWSRGSEGGAAGGLWMLTSVYLWKLTQRLCHSILCIYCIYAKMNRLCVHWSLCCWLLCCSSDVIITPSSTLSSPSMLLWCTPPSLYTWAIDHTLHLNIHHSFLCYGNEIRRKSLLLLFNKCSH